MNDWVLLILTTLLIGVGKVGFSGLSLIPVSIFASYFGKDSVGVLLPLLLVADLTIYPVMSKYGSWKQVWPLLPPALVGIGIGLVLLRVMPDSWAKPVIGSMILLMLGANLWKMIRPENQWHRSKGFGLGSALAGGVATTLANAAGPVMNMYLLTKGFAKMELVGVATRFFLLVNFIKLPLLGGIDLISRESLLLDLKLAPFVVVGVFLGKFLLKRVPQKVFGGLIVFFSILAVVQLFWPFAS